MGESRPQEGQGPAEARLLLAVDTRKLKDGPKVYSLRSVDMVGSSQTDAYIVFVDNTKPVIELARPSPGLAVHGRFSVIGAVRHPLGIKRLSFEFGSGEKGDIPLMKGDPSSSKNSTTAKIKGDSADVTLIAEDPIGNLTKLVEDVQDRPKGGQARPQGPRASGRVDRRSGLARGRTGVGIDSLLFGSGRASLVARRKRAQRSGMRRSFLPRSPPAASGKHVLGLVPSMSRGMSATPRSSRSSSTKAPDRSSSIA